MRVSQQQGFRGTGITLYLTAGGDIELAQTRAHHADPRTTKLYDIRGEKVMLDCDLAKLYGVETKVLVQAMKRNIARFPQDFMFQLSKEEFDDWRSQIVTSNPSAKMGLRRAPYGFTEQGVAMLSSVLRSKRAIQVNIQIIRAFVRLRELMLSHRDLARKLHDLEQKYAKHEKQFRSA